jgi:3-oxoacyl-[acyl-carrier protein] reductase
MSKLLTDKTVVITGCLRGIGKATVEVFAREGASIFACTQFPDTDFDAFIRDLTHQYTVEIRPVYFDLSDEEAVKSGMKQILASKIPIDGLVNIAGMVHNGLFQMTNMDTIRKVMEVDYVSQMLVTQYISKIMIKNKRGSIVNISSIAGIDGNPGQIAYSSAKAALIGATKTLSIELGQHNIRVNAVAPGVILTDMTRALAQDKFDTLVKKAKLPRAGDPEEVAHVLLYLISDMSSYVTGQVIRVDGGMG